MEKGGNNSSQLNKREAIKNGKNIQNENDIYDTTANKLDHKSSNSMLQDPYKGDLNF